MSELLSSHKPIVIAHRGASGYRPEHTLESYQLAIDFGADFIEPDFVPTKDGFLVARHENEISTTTDVAQHSEFADRKSTKQIDGRSITGWFTEDFTLEELKTLRARERLPKLRAYSRSYDGDFEIPSLDDILDLVAENEARGTGRGRTRIGIYPETKHPSYFAGIGLAMEEPLVAALEKRDYLTAADPIFIQSFEYTNLKKLSTMTQLPLIFLADADGAPRDFDATGDPRTYADLMSEPGFEELVQFVEGIGAHKDLIFPRSSAEQLQSPTSLVSEAHAAGLQVHAWTFRAENLFLPTNLRRGRWHKPTGIALWGDLAEEIRLFLQQGIDGFFTDYPDIGVSTVRAFESSLAVTQGGGLAAR